MASNGSLNEVKGEKKYGLILPQKTSKPIFGLGTRTASVSKATPKIKPKAKSLLLGHEDDTDEEEEKQNGNNNNNNNNNLTRLNSTFKNSSATSTSTATSTAAAASRKVNAELRVVHKQTSLEAQLEHAKAFEEDPTVFDYDGVYDALKHAEKEKRKAKEGELGPGGLRKARYMDDLMKAAAQRKIEQQRVEDRKIQRERQAEGDAFGDKEMFVTEAYKKQQLELKRLEEEEKLREAKEQDVTKQSDLTGFYRNLLDQTTHDSSTLKVQLSNPTKLNSTENVSVEDEIENESDNIEISKSVIVNDSGEIVDKRQLLSGGLNVSKKSRTIEEERRLREEGEAREYLERKRKEEAERRMEAERKRKAREEQLMRMAANLEQQAQERVMEEKKRKLQEEEELKQKLARKNDESAVMDARARYLARKAAAMESKKSSTGKSEDAS